MPIRKRREIERTDWTFRQTRNAWLFLMLGVDFFSPLGGDREAAREYWQSVRREYLAAYIERSPGWRPWAWWTFDRPDIERAHGETQTACLRRLNLLTASEAEALARKVRNEN